MLFASIDIGSNAARLLFSSVYLKNGQKYVKKESFVRVPLRLGLEVFDKGRLSSKKEKQLLNTIMAFKYLIDVNEPFSYKACATAAMREAENGREITKKIKDLTGIEIQIIDGLTEAKIIGATNNIPIEEKYDAAMFVDVGGGSTEITVIKKNKKDSELIASKSFKIGTIRILNNKVKESEWKDLKTWAKSLRKEFGNIYCIGSGGNINKIVKVYGNRSEKTVTYDNLKYTRAHLNKFTVEERIEKLNLRPDRADVIAPAAEIYLSVMKWTKIDAIFVPKIGLADGLIHLQYEKQVNEKA